MQPKSLRLFKPSGSALSVEALVADRHTGWMTASPTTAVFKTAMMGSRGKVAAVIEEGRA